MLVKQDSTPCNSNVGMHPVANAVSVLLAILNYNPFTVLNHFLSFTVGFRIHSPRLLIFRFFPTPEPYLDPHLLILRKLTFYTNPSFHFLSVLGLFTPNFHGKITRFCIYFSLMLYDNLFLFCTSLYNHLKRLQNFLRSPLF